MRGTTTCSAVGDEDQSIYAWRGADLRNMNDLLHDFGEAQIVKLEENYRSTKPILDAANGVIAHNTGRIGKTLRPRRLGGESVVVVAAADERDEAEWIARELVRRHGDGITWTECAVLYRTNAQSRALEDALRRSGVPYQIVGAMSFYERREVKDLFGYLRLIANPARRRSVPSGHRRTAAGHRYLHAGPARGARGGVGCAAPASGPSR